MNKQIELREPATTWCKDLVDQFLSQSKFDELNITIVWKDNQLHFSAGYAEIARR